MSRRLVPVSEASLVSSIFLRLISFAAVLLHTQGYGAAAYPIVDVSPGATVLSHGEECPRGRVANTGRLSVEGHLFPTGLFPFRAFEGVSAERGRIRGRDWAQGVASGRRKLPNELDRRGRVRTRFSSIPTSFAPSSFVSGQIRVHPPVAVRGLFWVEAVPSCLVSANYIAYPIWSLSFIVARLAPVFPSNPTFTSSFPPAPYQIRKMSASTKKGKGKATAPLSISSSSSSDAPSPPKPRPVFRKQKDAPESSPSLEPGVHPISQIAADVGDPSHRESKRARMSELDGDESSSSNSLDPAFENTHLDGAFHQINTREALGFEPVRVHEGDCPVPNTRPDGVLIAEARRFTDTDLPESVVPSKFGSADFVVLDSPYLVPVFNPPTSVATLIIRGHEFLNTLLPPPVLELPEPPTPQYIPFPPDATSEALEENFHRNKEISKLVGQAHARRKSEAVTAFEVAKTEYLSCVASLRRKFDRRWVKEHEAWRKHDELRRKISNHFLCVAHTYLAFAVWRLEQHERAHDVAVAMLKGPPGRAASEVSSLTPSPPSAKKKPSGRVVGGKVLRSSNSNCRILGAANVVDFDSQDGGYIDSGEEESDDTSKGWGVEPEPEPLSSRKPASKRRGARSDPVTDEPNFDEFCEEVYGHVVIGSRLKSGTLVKLSGLLSRKKSDGTVVTVAADSLRAMPDILTQYILNILKIY
ncbi:hypothetical protein C8J57DRAFT_1247487 [Mycena rebaudengoi]|nr:hypothetical protein C8J57DRAFT_1247487 [Mycena rebaudengoi]